MKPDFGATADDYARHREGFPTSLFERLGEFGVGMPGQIVTDLGTGTGTMARGFARRGCSVTGIDISGELLEQGRAIDRSEGVEITYRVASAEDTGLDSDCCDVVSAGQCWHWFKRDRAMAEVVRLLIPGGRLVIAHFDMIPVRGNVVWATERLIEKHNSEWRLGGSVGVHPWWLREVCDAGFVDVTTFSYDVAVMYSPERWRGRIRASAGVGASLDADAVACFDDDLALTLATDFSGTELRIPHRVFAIVARLDAL
jgi:SAM-dependent methyltransferase